MDRSVLINKGMSSRKKSLIFSILTFLVVVVGVLSATYAYFTASADQQNSYTFASMSLTLKTASGDVFDSDEFSATYNQRLTPGDSVNFSDIKVKNESSVDVYSLIKLVVEITKSSSTSADLTIKKWYNLSGQEVEQDDSGEIYLVNTSTKADATPITQNTTEATNITYTFPTNLDTTYTNATAEFTLTACAVQKDNLQTSQTRTASNFACYYIYDFFSIPEFTIYLDGNARTVATKSQTIAELDANDTTGVTTCGWFYDEDCTDPVPLDSTLTSVPLYTKTATMDMVTTTENSTGLTVTGSTSTTPTGEVIIPQKVNGVQVTEIATNAFNDKTGITNVIIPEGVVTIHDQAFYGCTGLTSVTIPNSVTTIGSFAFKNNTKLTSVKIYSEELDVLAGNMDIYSGQTSGGISSYSNWGSSFYSCSKLEYNEYQNIYYLGNENNPYIIAMKPKNKDIENVVLHQECIVIGSYAFVNNYIVGTTTLKTITLNEGLTKIGNYAFYNCRGITSIIFPSSVKSIGEQSFCQCQGLINVALNEGIINLGSKAFYNCISIKTANVPSTITNWGNSVFNSCRALSNLTLSAGLNSIGQYAFQYCSSLTTVVIPNSISDWGTVAFGGCTGLVNIILTDGLIDIGRYAFNGCRELITITIPSSITSINECAFQNCYKLVEVCNLSELALTKGGTDNGYVSYYAQSIYYTTSYTSKIVIHNNGQYYVDGETKICIGMEKGTTNLEIDNDCTEINSYAFYCDAGLMAITIPNNITSIGDYAFRECTGLTNLILSDGLKNVGTAAFYGCTGLTGVTIPSSITSISASCFRECTSLTSVTFNEGLTSIGRYAFNGCKTITSITIPSSVTSIADYAFYKCTGLTCVILNEGLTNIGRYVFRDCTKITSIIIPSTVTTISSYAFYSWKSSQTINCVASSKPSGWNSSWNSSCSATIVWGYTGE